MPWLLDFALDLEVGDLHRAGALAPTLICGDLSWSSLIDLLVSFAVKVLPTMMALGKVLLFPAPMPRWLGLGSVHIKFLGADSGFVSGTSAVLKGKEQSYSFPSRE